MDGYRHAPAPQGAERATSPRPAGVRNRPAHSGLWKSQLSHATLMPLVHVNGMYQKPPIRNQCHQAIRSEEHTSELQSLMRISYAVFCLKKKTNEYKTTHNLI